MGKEEEVGVYEKREDRELSEEGIENYGKRRGGRGLWERIRGRGKEDKALQGGT